MGGRAAGDDALGERVKARLHPAMSAADDDEVALRPDTLAALAAFMA